MKKSLNISLSRILLFAMLFTTIVSACKKKDDNNGTPTTQSGYSQVNLVSDGGYSASRTDANLVNAWGIAIGPTGAFWISANHTGKTTVYDRNGAELLPAISLN